MEGSSAYGGADDSFLGGKMRLTFIFTVIICFAVGFAGCENANLNSNTNTNMAANANRNENANTTAMASPSPASGRGQYTEEQAREERAKAKQNKETIGDSLDDAWIHTKVVAKLIGDTKTPERKINVDVVKNVVTLRGTVDTAEAKAEAERLAKDTDGVTKVVNQLKVAPASKTSNTNSNMNKSAKNKKTYE
jgi:BON domain